MAAEALESRTLLTIDFNFSYINEAGTADDVGFNDSNSTTRTTYRSMLENAAATLGTWFDHTATLDVDVFSYFDSGPSGGLAAASPRFSLAENPGFNNLGDAGHIVKGGSDPSAGDDMLLEVNFAPSYGTGLDVSSSQDDLIATLMHEIMHGLDFGTAVNFDGSSFYEDPDEWGPFDQFLSDVSGNRVINGSTFTLNTSTWNSVRTGGTSPSAGLFFDGPNAKAANGGNRVGLYSPSGWQDGSSASHVDDNNAGINFVDYLMVSNGGKGVNARVLNPVEFGMMQDIGYMMIQPGVTVTETGGNTSVTEAGTTDTFTVVLDTRPLEDITISVLSANTNEATVDKATLTFTTANWNVAQTVTVTGVSDSNVDGNQTVDIELILDTIDDSYVFATGSMVSATNVDTTPLPVPATVYTVNTILDQPDNNSTVTDGLISLREAMIAADINAAYGDAPAGSADTTDIINFAPSLAGMTITLGGKQLLITEDLTINGLGADQLTINANNQSRVLRVSSGNVNISGLTFTGGNARIVFPSEPPDGGAILNRGTLTLDSVWVTGNQANFSGGIDSVGVLVVKNSTVSNNSASNIEATAGEGGGIYATGTFDLINSTVSGNTAATIGAGVITGGTATITNSTITGNRATNGFGGGIHVLPNNSSLTLNNSIVAGNFQGATGTTPNDLSNTIVGSNNVIGDAGTSSGLTNGVNGNIVGVGGTGTRAIGTILNTTLQNNGGSTPTHALVPGSVALNTGSNGLAKDENNTTLTTDQRGDGFTRFLNSTVDIGAFEGTPPRTYVVDTLLDQPANGSGVTDGLVSLREAIEAANTNAAFGDALAGSADGQDIITFSSSLMDMTLSLNASLPTLMGDVKIVGLGADQLTIDGAGSFQPFFVDSGVVSSISGLTIQNGESDRGGAVRNFGSLTLDGVHVKSSVSTETGRDSGGGIWNVGTLVVKNSTISDNEALGSGGGIWTNGTLDLINTTVSGNHTPGLGGGIYSSNEFGGLGITRITNSTLTLNRADTDFTGGINGGGIYSLFGPLTLHNSIVAGNVSGTGLIPNELSGSNVQSTSSHNVIGDASSSKGLVDGTNGNIVGVGGSGVRDINTILNTTLQDNGGPTPTHKLVSGSVAINAGDNTKALDENAVALTSDQRGSGFGRINQTTVDVGAYEYAPARTFVVDTLLDKAANGSGVTDGLLSLREAIEAANTNLAFGDALAGSGDETDIITFSSSLLDSTIILNDQQLVITDDLIINGLGADKLEINANRDSRHFEVQAGATVEMSGLELSRGRSSNAGGGAIFNQGDLILRDMEFDGNDSFGDGGAILHQGDNLIIHNSLFHNNAAFEGRGGAIAAVNDYEIYNSTFTSNFAAVIISKPAQGGAIYSSAVVGKIVNSTFVNNFVVDNLAANDGGAIYVNDGSTLLNNTIIAGSKRGTVANEIFGTVTGSNNLIADAATSGGLSDGVNGNIVGVNGSGTRDINTILDPVLRDNGGSTRTHALIFNSLAINAGSNALAVDENSAALTTDQRGTGFDRILGDTVDIGAYESTSITNGEVIIRIDIAPSSLGYGIPGQDNATGNGFILYSLQSVQQRFAGAVVANGAEHFVAVRFVNNQWQYANNDVWVNFTPTTGDRLIAAVNFDISQVQMLQGSTGSVNGINQGYIAGDLTITPNQWRNAPNAGEFGITGTYFTLELTSIRIDIAPSSLGYGIPGQDNATGNGFILYSQQNVQQRFAGAVVANGAEHFVVVRFIDNQWQYANNDIWVNFTPTAGDRLIASVNFDSSQVQMLEGSTGSVNGINQGYIEGDLTITPNQWRDRPNAGEFGITGTYFTLELTTIRIDIAPSSLGYGIPGHDNAIGNGFILYSLQNVQQRFAGAVVANGAEHFVVVRFIDNQWQYANNDVWVDFTPTTGDRLIASVNFDSSQVQMLQGSTGSFNGINQGYLAGNLTITPNQWRNTYNAGEFGITGTYFILELPTIRIDIAPSSLGYGIPGQDNATGNGFILYSQQSVQRRFAGAVVANGAEHFLAVRFVNYQWQYANNDVWVNFTPTTGDRLIAAVNFDSSQVQMLQGSTGSLSGINQGYIEGDLTITPNQWRDIPNAGEFGITGTYFTLDQFPPLTTRVNIAPSSLGYGIPGQDNAKGNGFILYSQQSVQQRFAGAVVANGAEHFVVVRFINNRWQYANNDVWVNFTPTTGDRLIASVNFDSSQVQMLLGSSGSVKGIYQGYLEGDLTITPNQWRDRPNAGEFGISGSYFTFE